MKRKTKVKNCMLVGGIARLYYDDEKYNDVKVVGKFLDIDDVHLTDDSPYFKGVVFSMDVNHEGDVTWNRKEFNSNVYRFTELF